MITNPVLPNNLIFKPNLTFKYTGGGGGFNKTESINMKRKFQDHVAWYRKIFDT